MSKQLPTEFGFHVPIDTLRFEPIKHELSSEYTNNYECVLFDHQKKVIGSVQISKKTRGFQVLVFDDISVDVIEFHTTTLRKAMIQATERVMEGHEMKYIQPKPKYNGGVITDSPYDIPVTITEMYYDYRKTDSWKCVKPSNFVYPKARALVKQYRKEYAEKLADIDTWAD